MAECPEFKSVGSKYTNYQKLSTAQGISGAAVLVRGKRRMSAVGNKLCLGWVSESVMMDDDKDCGAGQ